MAVYRAVSKDKAEETCQILKTEQGEGFTIYAIEVFVPPFHWIVNHRYSEFHDLHEKLTINFGVDKNLLPPKKLFGNQSEAFIQRRMTDLQLYIQMLLQQFQNLPFPLAEFLDFPKYEIHGITENLAEKLFHQGDQILANKQEFTMTPLQLHAVSQRLKLAEPTCWSGSKLRDLGHLLDFISQLQYLRIVGSDELVGKSDIVPNKLTFDLSPFKSLVGLKVECCNLEHCLTGVEGLRQTVTTLSIHSSVQDLKTLILASWLHWSPLSSQKNWPRWQMVTVADFSYNRITKISPAVKLLSVVEHLDLSHNRIEEIEYLESLPRLSTLNFSHNQISKLETLHTRLGNVRHLNLSKNSISSLQGFSRLYSLAELDVSSNQISALDEVTHLGGLPCLEKLTLVNNPVANIVDYRPHVLLAFGARASELSIDGSKASHKELDTVAVLQALKAAREGRILRQSEQSTRGEKTTGVLTSTSGANLINKSCYHSKSAAEFQQQVTALRKLGGSDWLRLLKQLQKRTNDNTSSSYAVQSMKLKCECLSLISIVDNRWSKESSENTDLQLYFDSNSHYLIPDWLIKLDASNVELVATIEQTLSELSTRHLSGNAIDFISWIVLLSGSTNTPCCLVLVSQAIIFLKLKSISRIRFQNGKSRPKWPTLCHLLTLHPSEILTVVTGPCNSYLEIQIGSLGGIQTYTLFTAGQDMTDSIIDNFIQIYHLNALKKHAQSEFEDSVARGLQAQFIQEDNVVKDLLYCHRVVKLHCFGHTDVIHYLALTPSHLLTIEEIHNTYPFHDLRATFQICSAIGVKTNISSVLMKDDSQSHHTSPFEDEASDDSDNLQELCLCGYWLLIDFETGDLFHIRFLSQPERSRFLEVFLNARST